MKLNALPDAPNASQRFLRTATENLLLHRIAILDVASTSNAAFNAPSAHERHALTATMSKRLGLNTWPKTKTINLRAYRVCLTETPNAHRIASTAWERLPWNAGFTAVMQRFATTTTNNV